MNDRQRAMPASFEEIVTQLEPLLEELQSSLAYHGHKIRCEICPTRVSTSSMRTVSLCTLAVLVATVKQTVLQRIRQHTIPSSRHNQATFAFRLLQEDLGLPVGHESDMTRPEFAEKYETKFLEQKQRVRNMEVRVVEVTNSVVQAVFEIYAALTLGTTRYSISLRYSLAER